MTKLEQIFEELGWGNKHEYSVPNSDIVKVFREADAEEAAKFFSRNNEETEKVVRHAHLGEDSLGQCLCVTETDWSDIDE